MRSHAELYAIAAEVMHRMAKRGYQLQVTPASSSSEPHMFHGEYEHHACPVHGKCQVRVYLPHNIAHKPKHERGPLELSAAVEHVCTELSRLRFFQMHDLDPATGTARQKP